MSPVWRKTLPIPTTEEVAREFVVKTSLTKGLGKAIKKLQRNFINPDEQIANDEVTNTICFILEAIFIHGLKDTFIRRVTAILSGNVDKIPEPNFWPFLLVFTHKDVITQINQLNNIATDIGHCRAWLRIALNEGLLESYLSAMVKDKRSLQYYYSHTAYLRDPEQPDILRKYVESLTILNFNLVCNLQSLNDWTATPLMLAGIWAPPIAPEPVTTGVDVASYFSEDGNLTPTRQRRIKPNESELDSSTSTTNTMLPEIKKLSLVNSEFVLVNDDLLYPEDSASSSPASCPDPPPPIHNYKKIMSDMSSSPVDENYMKNIEETRVYDANEQSTDDPNHEVNPSPCQTNCWRNDSKTTPNAVPQTPSDAIRGITDGLAEAETSDDLNKQPHMGNSLCGKSGWSSSFDDDNNEVVSSRSDNDIHESESFHTLLKNYSPVSGSVIGTPNLNEIVNLMVNTHQTAPTTPMSPLDDLTVGFEIIPKNFSITSTNVDANTQALIDLISKIQNEKGLDSQNFQCKGCSRPVGMIYGKARVCSYDGCYYCAECHQNDEHVIPARIIHNWDFKKYKVAKHTKRFLEQIEEEPLIDLRKCNPSLYLAIDEMNEILNLRTQLSYLRSYLFTCRESVVDEFRRKLWPKEYLYEHIHLYALADLQQVPVGGLSSLLHKVISFATKHVSNCRLCRQKGFVCEICNNPQVIYPFQMELTFRCEICLAVYHSSCMNDKKPCPKCVRRKKHEGQADFLWTMED